MTGQQLAELLEAAASGIEAEYADDDAIGLAEGLRATSEWALDHAGDAEVDLDLSVRRAGAVDPAIHQAYEDAARIVTEWIGGINPTLALRIAERIVARADGLGQPGSGDLPRERTICGGAS